MDNNALLSAINDEIATLQQVRVLLTGTDGVRRGPGRASATSFAFGFGNKPRKKRVLSAEARAKIAAAQKKRWAKQKAAAKK